MSDKQHDKIRMMLYRLTSYALSCEAYNTWDWMDRLLDLCNESCELLGENERFIRDGNHFREGKNDGFR